TGRQFLEREGRQCIPFFATWMSRDAVYLAPYDTQRSSVDQWRDIGSDCPPSQATDAIDPRCALRQPKEHRGSMASVACEGGQSLPISRRSEDRRLVLRNQRADEEPLGADGGTSLDKVDTSA